MVGRPVELTVHKDAPKLGDDALVVKDLTVVDEIGRVHVDDVSFTIRTGEILAVAGVQGNGQTELTEALLGLQDHVRGSIRLDGQELVGHSVRQMLDAGVGFIPEDRQSEGLIGDFTLAENLMLNRSYAPAVRAARIAPAQRARRFAQEKLAGVRRPRPRHRHAGPASSPAATSRRSSWRASSPATCGCSWPPSRPAASTSAPSSSSTSRSSPPATPASRSSSCSTELDEVVALADRIMVLYRGAGGRHRARRHPPRGPRSDDDR